MTVWGRNCDLVAEFVAESFRDIKPHAGGLLTAAGQERIAVFTISFIVAILAGKGFLEDPRKILGGNTDTIVSDCEYDSLVVAGCGESDGFAMVFDTVLNNLIKNEL